LNVILTAAMMALIPPSFVLLVGWAVVWALKGFRA
jgi:hypothetical protein